MNHQVFFNGTQPIRVLQDYIPFTFENANLDILNLTNHLVDNIKFNPGLQYHINELPIRAAVNGSDQTPYATDGNEIHIHETFLSYVWCISYSLVTLYNTAHPSNQQPFSEEELEERCKLIDSVFSYGTSLIDTFSVWDKEKLPNPETYEKKHEADIYNANTVFLFATCFILYHEFSHVEREHFAKMDSGQNTSGHILEFEKEADAKAIKLMLSGATERTREAVDIGVLVGLCCILHLSYQVTGGEEHPDTDDRIHNFLEQLQTTPSDGVWGIAYVAYKLWSRQFSKNYLDLDGAKSSKEKYYYIRQQVMDEKKSGC
jgi:hypothetical protein